MADRISELLNNPEIYKKMSENAVIGIQPYSKEQVVEELKEVYKEYIG